MLDALNAAIAPRAVRRADYRAPEWLVPRIALDFDLDPAATRVRAVLEVERSGDHDAPLELDGDGLELVAVTVDGQPAEWRQTARGITIALTGTRHRVETEVLIHPERNTQLMGLYASGGLLCTQCEAEGFRRITYFPDRPDVLTRYSVRMSADKARYPVLLANGDPVGAGDLGGGRHFAEWDDPFPKPCYLVALVAGDLVANRDTFVTRSGRAVELGIWVRSPDLAKTDHALAALKTSMRWAEDV